jgi:hypothetical protein
MHDRRKCTQYGSRMLIHGVGLGALPPRDQQQGFTAASPSSATDAGAATLLAGGVAGGVSGGGGQPRSVLTILDHSRYQWLRDHDPDALLRCSAPKSAADADDRRESEIRSLVARVALECSTYDKFHRESALSNVKKYAMILGAAKERLQSVLRRWRAETLTQLPRHYILHSIALDPTQFDSSAARSPTPHAPTYIVDDAEHAQHQALVAAQAHAHGHPHMHVPVAGPALNALNAPSTDRHNRKVVGTLAPMLHGVPVPLGSSIDSRRAQLGKSAKNRIPVRRPPPVVNSDSVITCSILFHDVLLRLSLYRSHHHLLTATRL